MSFGMTSDLSHSQQSFNLFHNKNGSFRDTFLLSNKLNDYSDFHRFNWRGFLPIFQIYVYEFGLPELILSEIGSQNVCVTKIIKNWLSDFETLSYLKARSVNLIELQQYTIGCNEFGGLVESMVKLVIRTVQGAVQNSILDYFHFEFYLYNWIDSFCTCSVFLWLNSCRDYLRLNSKRIRRQITGRLIMITFCEIDFLFYISSLYIIVSIWVKNRFCTEYLEVIFNCIEIYIF